MVQWGASVNLLWLPRKLLQLTSDFFFFFLKAQWACCCSMNIFTLYRLSSPSPLVSNCIGVFKMCNQEHMGLMWVLSLPEGLDIKSSFSIRRDVEVEGWACVIPGSKLGPPLCKTLHEECGSEITLAVWHLYLCNSLSHEFPKSRFKLIMSRKCHCWKFALCFTLNSIFCVTEFEKNGAVWCHITV